MADVCSRTAKTDELQEICTVSFIPGEWQTLDCNRSTLCWDVTEKYRNIFLVGALSY